MIDIGVSYVWSHISIVVKDPVKLSMLFRSDENKRTLIMDIIMLYQPVKLDNTSF